MLASHGNTGGVAGPYGSRALLLDVGAPLEATRAGADCRGEGASRPAARCVIDAPLPCYRL